MLKCNLTDPPISWDDVISCGDPAMAEEESKS
jgi:hypothetical protein